MGEFRQRYRVGYRGLDAELCADAAVTIEYMQETGARHTDNTIYPMPWFAENKLGFIITGSVTEIMRPPILGEHVEVITAPIMFKGFFAERGYVMTGVSGETLARSFTSWVFISLESRRPARISKEIADSYGGCCDYGGTTDQSVPEPDERAMIFEETFRAPRRDADTNMHINNIAYIWWAEEYIPSDVYTNYSVKTVKARHKKECLSGSPVRAKTYAHGENQFITRFYNDNDGLLLTDIYTVWG